MRSAGDRYNKMMAGLMLPQPEIMTPQGQRVLLDEMLGPGFVLLRLHEKPTEAFAALKADMWRRLGVRFVCIQPGQCNELVGDGSAVYSRGKGGEVAWGGPLRLPWHGECVVVGDVQQEISKFLRNDQGLFVVVRPDRYIFGVFREEQAFVAAIQKCLELAVSTE